MNHAKVFNIFGDTLAHYERRSANALKHYKAENKVNKSYVLFSGGNDSLVLTHLAMERGLGDEVCHIDTGIGIPRTRRFVEETCEVLGWPLRIIEQGQEVYRDLILDHGFPGPTSHRYMYINLKERAVEKLVRETKKQRLERVGLITGARVAESRRRMGHTKPAKRKGSQVWLSPILDWPDEAMDEYRSCYDMPINPVSESLGMSGECLCGAYAQPGELDRIRQVDSEVASYIEGLQTLVRAKGHRYCNWEDAQPSLAPLAPTGELCAGCLFDHEVNTS